MDIDGTLPLQNGPSISGDIPQHRAEEECRHVALRHGLPYAAEEQDAISEQPNDTHSRPEVESKTLDVFVVTWHFDTRMTCISVHGPDFEGPYVKIQHHPKSGKPTASYIPHSEYFSCRQSKSGLQQQTDVYSVDLAPSWLGFKSYADFTFAETAFRGGWSNDDIDEVLRLHSNVWIKEGESQLSFKSHRDLLKIQRHHFGTEASKVRLLLIYTAMIQLYFILVQASRLHLRICRS